MKGFLFFPIRLLVSPIALILFYLRGYLVALEEHDFIQNILFGWWLFAMINAPLSAFFDTFDFIFTGSTEHNVHY